MRRTRVALLLALLTLVALLRVVAAGRAHTPTLDEPAHIAAGLEWLHRRADRGDGMYPPLAPVAVALGPWLGGVRAEEPRRLGLARAGVLPFLLMAILVVFAWARTLAGAAAGLLAALAFTSLPPVLAYAGLATADAAAMGTIALALFAVLRWVEAPTFPRTIGVGVAVGLALLAKVTALIFLPAALVVVLLAWRSAGNPVAPYVGGAAVAALAALLVVWAGYRFSIGPIHEGTSGAAAPRSEGDVAALLRLPVFPAPGYLRGALDLGREHRAGEPKPLAIVSGTPLPFLILALVGGAALALAARQRRSALVPPLGALAMLAAAMGAGIDLGIRHLLPVFPLLAVCAGVGVLTLWNRRRRGRLGMAGPVLAVGLGGWLVVDAALAHPDYLSWSNRLADWLIR